MMLGEAFEKYVESLEVSNINNIEYRFGLITKRLNSDFYNINDVDDENSIKIGSLGRDTAINGISDLDMIFELPYEKYKQYNQYDGNGQSALLQEVKKTIKKTYPSTKIRGDGQVVVIEFNAANDVIEVCPCFRNEDDTFTYPDANNGGKWKKTNPIPEQEKCNERNDETNNVFGHLCKILRGWKNKNDVVINGLLIDSLTDKFLDEYEEYCESSYEDYFSMLRECLNYFSGLNKEQKYWSALGSNQHVYNKDGGSFIDRADEGYKLLAEFDPESENVFEILQQLLGSDFPIEINESDNKHSLRKCSYDLAAPNEEFIDLDYRYPIRISRDIRIEGKAITPSNKIYNLSQIKGVGIGCSLKFNIKSTNVYGQYRVFWKVRNRGRIAKRKNMFRGEIKESQSIEESSNFAGSHFIECYIIKDGVCIAKDRLTVNIMKFKAH